MWPVFIPKATSVCAEQCHKDFKTTLDVDTKNNADLLALAMPTSNWRTDAQINRTIKTPCPWLVGCIYTEWVENNFERLIHNQMLDIMYRTCATIPK